MSLVSHPLTLLAILVAAGYLPYFVVCGGAWGILYGPLAPRLARWRIPGHRPFAGQVRQEIGISMGAIAIWVGAMLGLAALHAAGLTRLTISLSPPPAGQIALEVGVAYLALDGYWYWTHRAMHHPRLFSWVHATHHRFRHPTPWASWAQGGWESAINAVPYLVVPLVFPVHIVTLFALHAAISTLSPVGHLGYEVFPAGATRRLPLCLFNSALHHAVHHTSFGFNFGSLTALWDRVARTNHPRFHDRFDALVEGRRPACGAAPQAPRALKPLGSGALASRPLASPCVATPQAQGG